MKKLVRKVVLWKMIIKGFFEIWYLSWDLYDVKVIFLGIEIVYESFWG